MDTYERLANKSDHAGEIGFRVQTIDGDKGTSEQADVLWVKKHRMTDGYLPDLTPQQFLALERLGWALRKT